jgi:type I restriction enzyme R subunit
MTPTILTNISCLREHDEQLLRLGLLAEKYFSDDPNMSILKLRQLTELLAQIIAARAGIFVSTNESQFDLLQGNYAWK